MDTITLEVTPTPPVCTPPQVAFCETAKPCVCILTPPPPPRPCQVTITYSDASPGTPQVDASPWCDSAGVELAVAVALARLLGGPR